VPLLFVIVVHFLLDSFVEPLLPVAVNALQDEEQVFFVFL